MNLVNTISITAACLTFGAAHASGPTSPRIEPEVIAPECSGWFRCHEPRSYDEPEGGDRPDIPAPPKPPKEVECSSLWTPGAVLANGGKKCASLI